MRGRGGREDGGELSGTSTLSRENDPNCDATETPREPRGSSVASLHQELTENNLMGVSPINGDPSSWLIVSNPSANKREDTHTENFELETKIGICLASLFPEHPKPRDNSTVTRCYCKYRFFYIYTT